VAKKFGSVAASGSYFCAPVAATKLTDCCDDGGGKEQSSGEFPLRSEAIRHELDDVGGDLLILRLVDAELLLQPVRLLAEPTTLGNLVFRLQRVEHRGAYQQVSERTDDQRQRSDVLTLHRKPTTQPDRLQLTFLAETPFTINRPSYS